MSQCVPSWDLDDPPNPSPRLLPSSSSARPKLSMSDYEVAELTWENGQLSAHGLVKPTPKYRPSAAGTLESVVDQAKLLHPSAPTTWHPTGPHNAHYHAPAAVDAVVPIRSRSRRSRRDHEASGIGSSEVSGDISRKRSTVGELGSAAANAGSGDDTDDPGFGTTNSVTPYADDDGNGVSGSPDTENTSFVGGGGSRLVTVVDEHDSVSHSRRSISQREMAGEEDEKATEGGTVRSNISTKRSRVAAIHNQSERKRRDRINQKMRTLQKLVPNSSKTDKASMLDEVIEYLKQLQAQVQMMSRMSNGMPPAMNMMMPMSMQQAQFQMTMMAQMAHMAQMVQMGMGMMDMASLSRAGPAGISPVMPASAFLPMIGPGSWDPAAAAAAERMQQPAAAGVMPDPFSAFVACPPQQQMTMDAYQRMAALYQSMFQQTQPTNPK